MKAMLAVLIMLPSGAWGMTVVSPSIQWTIRSGGTIIQPPFTQYIGQITAPGAPFSEETFLEFETTESGRSKVIAELSFAYSDVPIGGTGKNVSVSSHEATGVVSIDPWRSGDFIGKVLLPTTPVPIDYTTTIDVTDAYNQAIAGGTGFFGIRLHDPMFNPGTSSAHPWTQAAIGRGLGIILPQRLILIPEPSGMVLLFVGLVAFVRARATPQPN